MTRPVPAIALAVWLILASACGASSLEKASSRAEDKDKPLLVMASADWCGPCKDFKALVLPDPRVQRALEELTFVILDDKRDKGSLRRLKVGAFPTFVFVNGQEEPVTYLQGGAGVDRFVEFVTWGVTKVFTREQIDGLLAERNDYAALLMAARWFAVNGDRARSLELYARALAGVPATKALRRADLEWERLQVASARGSAASFAKGALELLRHHPGGTGQMSATRLVLFSEASSAEDKAEVAAMLVAHCRKQTGLHDRVVYLLLAAGRLDDALMVAQEQIQLHPDDANARDTLAEVHHYRGDKGAAIGQAAEALRLAKSRRMRRLFSKNLQRFEAPTFLPSPDAAAVFERHERLIERLELAD